MYEQKFMQYAIRLAKECASHDEVPVGAVVVKGGEVIASGGNMKERQGNAVCHAEIVALSKAAQVVGNWWLEGCELYVTMEPCPMCAGAIINSRVDAVYFGAYDAKAGACGSKVNLLEDGLFNHKVSVSGGHMQEECAALLSEFFAAKRKRKGEEI